MTVLYRPEQKETPTDATAAMAATLLISKSS
jgi:hypothetical protein